jgi:predicted enzyme related to lactoylglutathione lyase
MPSRTSYLQGTPNWVDLQSTDQDGAKSFYGDLFGWTFDDQPIPDGGGVYSMAMQGDGVVAAIAAQLPDMAAQNLPSMWNTYLAVDDVDAAAARVDAAGGKILMPSMDIMDAGRMAFVADPTGAPIALWQAYTNIGATLVNEPGAVSWNELQTDDLQAAANFYSAVLGITTETMPGDTPYLTFKVDGRDVAGITVAEVPGTPASWQVYFAVEDTAATVAKAEKLGGTTIAGPIDTPFGAMAALRDPQGGFFNVIAVPAP